MPCARIPGSLPPSLSEATRRQCYELDFLEMGAALLEIIDWE